MDLKILEVRLGCEFKDKNLLEQALTHRSYLNEAQEQNLVSNERLEFLGDAILSLIVSQFLYQTYNKLAEGDLTNLRAALVKTQTLTKVSRDLNLGDYLLLSRGEEEEGGRKNPGILADTFESLIGAIFIDQGLTTAANLISRYLFPLLPEIIKSRTFKDFKSFLQEKIQATSKSSPIYKVLQTTGPDHKRIFTVGVFIAKEKLGVGGGHSKQEAEQEAAKDALEKLHYLK